MFNMVKLKAKESQGGRTVLVQHIIPLAYHSYNS